MTSEYPKRFYGLHFSEGCAQYRPSPDKTFMIFISEPVMKKMDATFEGKPVFVGHRDEVTPEIKPDGHVVKSFFNKSDGKHWVEFIVTTDAGLQAIRNGWKLSNAYKISRSGAGGRWHGIDYDQEIVEGDYEHLAIVDDPRYEESIILSPTEFQAYNERKDAELKSLQNSKTKKTGEKSMFSFFKKEKVENSTDLEGMLVILPKSKKEVEVAKLINQADEKAMNEGKPEYAVKHMLVKTNEGEMSVEELVNKYNENCDMLKKKNEEDEEKKKENKEDEEGEDKKENKEDKEDEKENEQDVKEVLEDKKQNSNENFNSLKNAHEDFESGITLDLSFDQVERGKSRYGSNK